MRNYYHPKLADFPAFVNITVVALFENYAAGSAPSPRVTQPRVKPLQQHWDNDPLTQVSVIL